jgi:hypothetical protein
LENVKAWTRQDIERRLASASGRRDEAPNIALAEELYRDHSPAGIAFVADILETGNREKQSDAIKVLYDIGARDPHLIVPHTQCFLKHIRSRNNRLVWGALTALAEICEIEPGSIGANLDAILAAADSGSVIAKDQAIQILITLKSDPDYAQTATGHLFERLQSAALNQLPMYAERVSAALQPADRQRFLSILIDRISDDMPESKRKRLQKVIVKVQRMPD